MDELIDLTAPDILWNDITYPKVILTITEGKGGKGRQKKRRDRGREGEENGREQKGREGKERKGSEE